MSQSQSRARAIFALKAAVATALIVWLVRSGTLDFRAMRLLVDRPILLALDIALFVSGLFVGALRFRALLKSIDIRFPVGPLLRLQLTALFFNVVIPGNIGGDFIKALYVSRDAAPEKRTSILLLVFVERLIGVAALVMMGATVTLLRAPVVFGSPVLRPLGTAVVLLGGATFVGGAVALLVVRHGGARLDRYTTGTTKIAKVANQLIGALRLLSASPRGLFEALGLSVANHVLALVYFTVLTGVVVGHDVPYSSVVTVFPLGLLTLMLPISPSGLGVGHVAFQRLFETIGLAGGATIFNIYLLGQIAPALAGVFPFLALRKRGEIPTSPPEAAAGSSTP